MKKKLMETRTMMQEYMRECEQQCDVCDDTVAHMKTYVHSTIQYHTSLFCSKMVTFPLEYVYLTLNYIK